MTLCQRYLFQCTFFHKDGCKAANSSNCTSRTIDSKLLQGRNRKRKVIWGFENHSLLFIEVRGVFQYQVDPQELDDHKEGRILIKWQENNLCLLNASYSNDFNLIYWGHICQLSKIDISYKGCVMSLNNNLKLYDLTVGTTHGMS